MAGLAIGRELGCCMVGIGGLVVVGLMASDTGGRGTGVIACMTGCTGKCNMRTLQNIIIVVYCKGRRSPPRVCGMTIGTGSGNTD